MKRTREQWANCVPERMANGQSRAAIQYAFADAKADIFELYRKNDALLSALSECVNFIENVPADDPDRTSKFFAVREVWRQAFSTARGES